MTTEQMDWNDDQRRSASAPRDVTPGDRVVPMKRADLKATRTPNRWIPRPEFRRYLYGVLAAAGPLAVFYGIASNEEVVLWLGLGATALGTPGGLLASANTPRD